MDASHNRMKRCPPGPWRFHTRQYNSQNVIVDADGRMMACNVPIGAGPLLAAGPELLAALQRVAEVATVGSSAHNVAVDALERFAEREGMTLADWQPALAPRPRPRLRIVGIAT